MDLPKKRESTSAKERGVSYVASQFVELREYAIELCSVLSEKRGKNLPRFPRIAMRWAASELHIHPYGGFVIKSQLPDDKVRFPFGSEPRTGNEMLNLIEGYHQALNDIHDALILERKGK